jgi:hypothetical protein
MKRRHLLWLAALIACAAGYYFTTRSDDDSLRVPLGVEQAAIVTYSGPKLAVAPYKWGVAVNLRIAEIIEHPDRRLYDLRYIVNRAGTFDLKDYLVAENGSPLEGLPSFTFEGDPKLAKDLDTRIQETEEPRLEVGGYYYETMAALTLLWIGWLLLLLFWKRPRPPTAPDPAPPPPTLAERMRDFLAQLETDTLTAHEKAQLEMTLLHCWRGELGLQDHPMHTALDQIAHHGRTSEALKKLQHWLHHPHSPVLKEDIASVIKPYTVEPIP